MTNLRVLNYEVVDSKKIKIIFTEKLSTIISTDNIEITSVSKNIPNAQPQKVSINNNVLYITTAPLTPLAFYNVRLFSTNFRPFKSVSGSLLYEDNNTNKILIQAPHNPDNMFYNRMVEYLKDQPYDVDSPGIIKSYLEITSNNLYKAYNDIRQAKSDNYLSINVIDEIHKRSKGPYDRLVNEGVFEITRVGLTPTDTSQSKEIKFQSFPYEPISLQQEEIINEKLFFGEKNIPETFYESTCTLSKSNIIKINSIKIIYSDSTVVNYDINDFGYLIKDSRYDSRASTYTLLQSNQFKFSDKAILKGFIVPTIGDNIIVSYVYKNKGININPDSINIYSIKKQIREVCPPLRTVFDLDHSFICDKDGKKITSTGVLFLDPLSTPPFLNIHPAFKKEITFEQNKLPIHPGEYSIDYETGKVYVFGEESTENVGSGLFPPAATYFYRQQYKNTIDYNYEPGLKELAANPKRNLINEQVIIDFDYEQILIPDIDYKEQIHKEELAERAENRITGNGAVQVLNSPITNVFKVFNETTGEVYGVNRFNEDTIYFSYQTPPLFVKLIKERIKFEQISGEILIKTDEFDNSSSIRIFKFILGTTIMSSTEDSIGSSINTSIIFEKKEIFEKELYYEGNNDLDNVNVITNIGEYVINYNTGTIWVGVSGIQTDNVGLISYKTKNIITDFPHISNVINVYSFIDEEVSKTTYDINSFTDSSVDLLEYPNSNKELTLLSIDTIETFEQISFARKIYDKAAIVNKVNNPIDFSINSVSSYSYITISPIEYIKTLSIESDGQTIYVPDLMYTDSKTLIYSIVSIKKASNGEEIYFTTNSDGSFTNDTITLPSDSTGLPNENVIIRIYVFLQNNTDVIVDYNRGEMYIDYIYCNDEIIVSYEYGDNCLDFREASNVVQENMIYYVSYKYGALRDALFENFGTLINIDLLKNFNVDLDRERYREAIIACLQTFPKGSQVQAIKNIAKIISHAEPDLWESFNDEWILGEGYLYNNQAETSGQLSLVPGKFNYSVDISNSDELLAVPFVSHVKLEQGVLEFFVTPKWNGIDNDAALSIIVKRDGLILSSDNIWIGSKGYHPELDYQNYIHIIKEEKNYGLPSDISNDKYGAFIYYDIDENKWKILFKDENIGTNYTIKVVTDGEFYNVKGLFTEVGDNITTKSKEIEFSTIIDAVESDGYSLDGYVTGFSFDGISFMSDREHYLFDYLADPTKPNESRISLLKDGRGYLTFKVFAKKDINNKAHLYQLSKDVSDWKNGEEHFVAVSWRLATKDNKDEIHLFVDGEEVPNILKFGGRPVCSVFDRFRTIVPEIISTPAPANTLTNIDLEIVNGSDIVTSKNSDFGIAGISPGSLLYIDNPIITGPGIDGYFTILEIVDANSVRLDYTFGFNMNDVEFTVNPWSIPVFTNIIYESNITVSIIQPGGDEIEIPGLRALVPSYSVSVNTQGQPILTIRGNVQAGDQIAIRTLGLNYKRTKERYYNWGTVSNIINNFFPPPINLDQVKIIPIIFNRRNIDISSPVYIPNMQPSSNNGRSLEIIISNVSNCNFVAQDIEVEIVGTTYSGAASETIIAAQSGSYFTTEQFITITSINCSAVVINPALTAFALEIKEAYSLTYQENDGYFAILRFSNKESSLSNLDGYNSTIISTHPVFDDNHLGYGLVLTNPPLGSFVIEDVLSAYEVLLTDSLPYSFTDGYADLYNIGITRSGYSNGLFTLELAGYYGNPFYLLQGYYELDYMSYLDIPFEIKQTNCFIGSDAFGKKQAKAIIEELRVLNNIYSDTRIGEVFNSSQNSITSDYNTVKAFVPNKETTLLMHFDEKPFIDSSLGYSFYNSDYIQADKGVNNNFSSSIYINQNPLIIDNTNILFNNEGSIEFWVSSKFDTANDPKYRMYFDAVSSSVENIISLTKRDIKLQFAAKHIISIIVEGNPNINYADGAVLANDFKTIRLGKELPNQNMNIQIIYIPFRGKGDRISIYKSPINSINFDIVANGKLSSLSTPIFWNRDSWHKVLVTWKCNTNKNQDEMKLFVDGIEKNKIVFGLGLNFSNNYTFNQLMTNSSPKIKTTINLREKFNKLFIGSNAFGGQLACARIDNLKISKKQKKIITISNQQIDNDYNKDTSKALPVIEDIYTTYLMNFDKEVKEIEDFCILKNELTGIFDFELDVIDSFSIIKDNPRSKELLETLIKQLKPAVSRALIKYIK